MSTVPQRLGKYEMLERLGHGGVAEVWKARDSRLQRFVAIKLLQPNLRDDPDFIKRFEREAQFIASLHHPNIMQIHDFHVVAPGEAQPDNTSPVAYMVMDYVEGQTLADYIQATSARGQFPNSTQIVNLFASISRAVDYAHQKGMIHRDIKPANILLDKRNTTRNPMGEPILTDFGVAKLLSTATNTVSGAQLGTPLYVSPEQARGYPGNERSDLYSLGIILYELVTGVTPFRGDTPVDVLSQHANAIPPAPTLINPEIQPNLALVIMRSIAKNPEERFSSASAMSIALAEALHLPIPEGLAAPGYPPDAEDMPTHLGPVPVALQNFNATPTPSSSRATTTAGHVNTPNFTPRIVHPTPGVAAPALAATPGVFQQAPQQVSPYTPLPPVTEPPPAFTPQPRRRRGLLIALIVAILLVLIGSGVGAFLLASAQTPPPVATSNTVGQAFYVSSGQITAGTAQGIADQLKINLKNIQNPTAGKSYYAWLLPDKQPEKNPDDTGKRPIQPPILLTNNLEVHNNAVDYFYQGDAQHNNLLSTTSRLLITEEPSGQSLKAPSTDHKVWRYYAEIPQEQIPGDGPGFTALVHIRHLFYNETNIQVLGLPGGLDFWMSKNTEKVLEWAISARDYWQGQNTSDRNLLLMKYQLERILQYLDGTQHFQVDLPKNTPLRVDPEIARVALLSVGAQLKSDASTFRQDPPGYVDHVQLHVGQVTRAPHLSKELLQHATKVLDAVNRAKDWLTDVRQDAVKLYQLGNDITKLRTPEAGSLLADLATKAQYAYLGQLDPTTDSVKSGVLQAHYEILQLAVLTVSKEIPK